VAELWYPAVLAVLAEVATVTEVASRWGVPRQTVHAWLARHEQGGPDALMDRSHRLAQ
jgi:transposase-like protein